MGEHNLTHTHTHTRRICSCSAWRAHRLERPGLVRQTHTHTLSSHTMHCDILLHFLSHTHTHTQTDAQIYTHTQALEAVSPGARVAVSGQLLRHTQTHTNTQPT
jgi:hypothetical protein